MKSLVATMATAVVALAASNVAFAATLAVEPADRCYREQQRVFYMARGYTPNGVVEFSRDSKVIERIRADGSGTISGNLRLPGLTSGRRRLTYVATDQTNRALSAQVSLLTTSTTVSLRPERGRPSRRLRIRARGYSAGRTLWAHIVRDGRPRSTARRIRIGRVRGPCGTVETRRRLFRAGTAPGEYRVQFDTFRSYRKRRNVQFEYIVTIFPPGHSSPQRGERGNNNNNG
jgi:hypothetical protein